MNIEKRTIDDIPESERHGKVKNLFKMWFAANIQVVTITTGAVAITL
jgi:NCS1 family nucleobase:cation symporter-1